VTPHSLKSTHLPLTTKAMVRYYERKKDLAVVCMDCKFGLDDSADFRQKELFSLKDAAQEDPLDVRAEAAHINYIRLDGNIGCMGNF